MAGAIARGRRARGLCVVSSLALVAATSRAQPARPPDPVAVTPLQRPPAPRAPRVAEPGSELTIYILTMGPGDEEVWERFGHDALWVHDALHGSDLTYNWGMFSFEQPHFVARFLTGDTRYWMEPFDLGSMLQPYVQADRSVWAQELNLAPRQRAALRDFLEWNAQPENRYYRYDYYRDNCTTRVRDAIDRVIGGRLRAATVVRRTANTYRSWTQRLTASDPLVYTGITIALGEPADRPLSVWDDMFLPTELQRYAREVMILDSLGRPQPLVRAERTLYAAHRPPEPSVPPRRAPLFLLAGVGVAGLIVESTRRAARGSGGGRVAFGVLSSLWALLAGVIGTALVLAWTVTRHVFMGHNENLLQLVPLALLLVALAPAAAVRRGRVRRAALALAGLLAASSAVGLAIKLLPSFSQHNLEVIALALPVNVALWWGIRTLAERERPT